MATFGEQLKQLSKRHKLARLSTVLAVILLLVLHRLIMAGYELIMCEVVLHEKRPLVALRCCNNSLRWYKTWFGYVERAKIYQGLQLFSYADADLTRAIKLGGDNESCYYWRGSLRQVTGYLSAAMKDYALSTKAKPSGDVYSNMSDIDYRLNMVAEAHKLCDLALKLNEKSLVARLNRAQCFMYEHDYQMAIDDLDVVVKHRMAFTYDNESPYRCAHMLRAEVLDILGRHDEANEDRSKVQRYYNFTRQLDPRLSQDCQMCSKGKLVTVYSQSSQEEADAIAENADRFLNFVNQNMYALPSDFSVKIFVYRDKKRYDAHCEQRHEFEKMSTLGHFEMKNNSIITYSGSSIGTIFHELTHKVLEKVAYLDPWAVEGIPSIFENCYGYPDGNSFHLLLGSEDPKRLRGMIRRSLNLRLTSLLAIQYPERFMGKVHLVAIFLYKNHLLRRYVELCQSGRIGDYATMLEAAFGQRSVNLEPKWQKFLQSIRDNQKMLLAAPETVIYKNKETFELADKTSSLKTINNLDDDDPENALINTSPGLPNTTRQGRAD